MVAAGLLAAGLFGAPAHAAAATSLTAGVPAPTVRIAGETTVVRGQVSGGTRALQLQRWEPNGWYTFARTTAVGGSYRFSVAAPTYSRTLRVLAPATRTHRARSVTLPVAVARQEVTRWVPSEAVTREIVHVRAKFSPARQGRPVQLQRWTGSAWQRQAAGSQGPGGGTRLTLPTGTVGTTKYRIITMPWRGAGAKATRTFSVRVLPPWATTITARVKPNPSIRGERVSIRGTVSGGDRRVQLQNRDSGNWRTQATTTSAGGRYSFQVRAKADGERRYRVRATKVRLADGQHLAASREATVRTVPQGVVADIPEQVARDSVRTAKATFSPARPGRRVVLERRTTSGWAKLAGTVQDSAGTATMSIPSERLGETVYRFKTLASRGAAAVATAPATTTVLAPVVRLDNVESGETLTGERVVTGTAADLGEDTRVSLFVGGDQVAEAAVAGDGSWTVGIDTAALENGATDIVVLARGDRGAGLSDAVPVRIDNGTGWPADVSGFRVDVVASGLDLPTSFARIDDHRTLVTEKGGKVLLLVDGVVRSTPVLDLSGSVATDGDLGLLGIVLAPDFADSGNFFLHLTAARTAADDEADPSGQRHSQQVLRYTLAGDQADPASRTVVLGGVTGAACFDAPATPDCLPTMAAVHTGGDLAFLPDGSLLVTMGDGTVDWNDMTSKLRAQDPDILAGKILRIDPDTGQGVPDNPLFSAADPGTNRGRVVALGVRNPFRVSLAPDGDLVVADVGEFSVEEVNRIPSGGVGTGDAPVNLGWPCFEGSHPVQSGNSTCADMHASPAQVLAPALQYGHVDWRGSVTGGLVYAGDDWPEEYRNRYVFGDYTFSKIWAEDLPPAGSAVNLETSTAPALASGVAAGAPVKFGMGPHGDVWFLSITTGEVRRIVHDDRSEGCPSERYRVDYFANDTFSGVPVLTACERTLPADAFTLPMGVSDDNFSVRWSGRPKMEPGPYAVTRVTDGQMRLIVEGQEVADSFTVTSQDLGDPAPSVRLELSGSGGRDDAFQLDIQPVGEAPTVTLAGLPQGQRLSAGETAEFTATARHGGADVDPGVVRIRIRQLHYNRPGTSAHSHFVLDRAGGSASFDFDDAHEPGSMAYQVQAFAQADDGTRGASAPIYVCLSGNRVGPCR